MNHHQSQAAELPRPRASHNPNGDLPHARVKRPRKLPFIWLVPVAAAIAAAWLVIASLRHLGPTVTITFVDGNGIQANQTVLKYHGVPVGEVTAVQLNKDLQHVTVQVRLQRSAAGLARDGTQFWIVRPEVSTGGFHGLETIVSGPYLQAKPGSGKTQKRFTGLEQAPEEIGRDGKFEVTVTTPQISTLSIGSSVYYRGIEVGTVSYFALNNDAKTISIHLLIETNFASLIRSDTKFWNAGGISFRLRFVGLNISAENLKSLIIGGIAFATPTDPGAPAHSGDTYTLYDKPEKSWLEWSPNIPITSMQTGGNANAPSVLINDVTPAADTQSPPHQ
jgi:paraquat-inducible protein B